MTARSCHVRKQCKNLLRILPVAGLFTLGCTHTLYSPEQSLHDRLPEINEHLEGEDATISLMERPAPIPATEISVTLDSVRYLDGRTDMERTLATSAVRRITTKDGGRGASEGIGIGFLAYGALVGATALAAQAGGDNEDVQDGPGGGIAVYWVALGAAPLPIVSMLVGAVAGSKNVFILNRRFPR